MDGYYRVHVRLTARADPLLLSVAECGDTNIAGLMRDSVNAFVHGEKMDVRIPPDRPCCASDERDVIVTFRKDKDADAVRFLTERCAKPSRAVKQIFSATIAPTFSGSCSAGSALVPEGTAVPEVAAPARDAPSEADGRTERGGTGDKERGDARDTPAAGTPRRGPDAHGHSPARPDTERAAKEAETPEATAPAPDGADGAESIWDMFDRV